MENTKPKYNRLELLLLSHNDYDHMEFQPYKDKGLYILNGIDFILYDVQPNMKEKIELIRRITSNKIEIEKPTANEKGYFGEIGFENYAMNNEIVIFSFLYIEKDMEHLVIPFIQDKICNAVEEFGYLYDSTILNIEETIKYMKELKEKQHIQFLEKMATISYVPIQSIMDVFSHISIDNFLEEYFGEPATIKEVNLKFKELSKIYHPDAGGDVLMFKAISNSKRYLISKIESETTPYSYPSQEKGVVRLS